MSGFEDYAAEAQALEMEIQRMGIALGVDWSDQVQVRALAHEAVTKGREEVAEAARSGERLALTKAELFGLAELMLKTMEESANEGFLTQGGPIWKAFGQALLEESRSSPAQPSTPPTPAAGSGTGASSKD